MAQVSNYAILSRSYTHCFQLIKKYITLFKISLLLYHFRWIKKTYRIMLPRILDEMVKASVIYANLRNMGNRGNGLDLKWSICLSSSDLLSSHSWVKRTATYVHQCQHQNSNFGPVLIKMMNNISQWIILCLNEIR